jgi:hypothetical protein
VDVTLSDPYSFGPSTPHDQPFNMGTGPMDPGTSMPNLAPMDPDTSPSDGPDVPAPYAPIAMLEDQ